MAASHPTSTAWAQKRDTYIFIPIHMHMHTCIHIWQHPGLLRDMYYWRALRDIDTMRTDNKIVSATQTQNHDHIKELLIKSTAAMPFCQEVCRWRCEHKGDAENATVKTDAVSRGILDW
jgi:hypothetical protein